MYSEAQKDLSKYRLAKAEEMLGEAAQGERLISGENPPVPARVYEDICRLAEEKRIQKVILFGSRARGTHRPGSDLDLAVSGGDVPGFAFDVEEKAWTLLTFDVINLDEKISDSLRREIERDGITIYEKI